MVSAVKVGPFDFAKFKVVKVANFPYPGTVGHIPANPDPEIMPKIP